MKAPPYVYIGVKLLWTSFYIDATVSHDLLGGWSFGVLRRLWCPLIKLIPLIRLVTSPSMRRFLWDEVQVLDTRIGLIECLASLHLWSKTAIRPDSASLLWYCRFEKDLKIIFFNAAPDIQQLYTIWIMEPWSPTELQHLTNAYWFCGTSLLAISPT